MRRGCEKRSEYDHQGMVEKVVKRGLRVRNFQVIENVRKINFRKCPKEALRYDIMVL
jgi:hypothetical protein